MKNIFMLVVFSILLLTINSCKKETTDPCSGITCYNGGTCANGICNCPQNYSGSDCSQQKTPTHIVISKVDVIAFSDYNSSGTAWDVGSTPDIFPVIALGSTVLFSNSNNHISDAINTTTYSFNVSPPIDITDVINPHYNVNVYDYDPVGSNEFMDGFYFAPYNFRNGFPSSVLVGDSAPYHNLFKFRVYYTYTW